jgi:hypothetical protein
MTMTATAEVKPGQDLKRHWIYVLGGEALREKARLWQERKTSQGKVYAVLPAAGQGTLARVDAHDVLYVYADKVSAGLDLLEGMSAAELAAHLRREGLCSGHRSVKVFASRSGDTGVGQRSYAERLYEEMRAGYPGIVVDGYRGEVDAEGFDGHKTAGLPNDETVGEVSREEWTERKLRAKENRVRFPATAEG